MATVGDIKSRSGVKKSLCLMAAQAIATTPPTAATDGLPTYPDHNNLAADTGAFFGGNAPCRSTLTIHNSAGSGALNGVFTLFAFLAASGQWYPIKVNGGGAITGTGTLRYQETFLYELSQFDRLFLDVQSPGGTGPQFEAWLTTPLENT